MKISIAVLLLASFLLSSFGAEKTAPPETFDISKIDAYLAAEAQQKGRVGLSVAIAQNGKIVFEKGYGKGAGNAAVAGDTMFAIGSVTKQFTCACIFLLAQDGRLSVRDLVSRYYPTLTRAKEITLLDLMNHTSGYPDYYPLDFVDRRMQKPIAPDDLIQQYAGGKLDFEPGTEWSYSNTGFIILGRVIEKLSKKPFGEFLRDRILGPLGMTHTSYEPATADGRLATGYTSFALSPPEPVAPEASGWLGAAGGIYSTPGDLVKWDLALIEGKVLKPEFYKLMTTSRQLSNGKITGYGCGIAVAAQDGRAILRHGGAVSGFNAFNAIVPSTKSAIVLLCNKDGGLRTLPETLTSLVLKEESNIPKVAGLAAIETVKKVFAELQSGNVDRRQFGEEFNLYLSDEKVVATARRLKPMGTPKSSEVVRTYERGGMEVTTTRLKFQSKDLDVLMYRMPNGKIEQFFVDEH